MRPSAIRLMVALFLCAGAAGCVHGMHPRGEGGRPQVIFLGVEGARDPRVDARVEELVRRRFDVIDRDAYRSEAKRLGAQKMTRKNLAKVATSLGAVALVHGSARGKSKRRQSVTIFVRDPKTGKIKERYRLSVRRGVLAKRSDRALEKRLLASVKIAKPPPPPKEEPPPAEEPAAEPVAAKGPPAKGEPAKGEPAKGEPAKGEPAKGEAEDEEGEDPAPAVQYDGDGQAIDDELPPM